MLRSSLLLIAALAAPSMLVAADAAPAPAPKAEAKADCCNTTCPVDGKPIDPAVPAVEFKTSHGPKHPEIQGKLVGCCSVACADKLKADPAAYEATIFQQWQQKNEAKVK